MTTAAPALPSPLVAVLLVTSTSSRGPQLVFRYPRRPRLQRRFSNIRYYAASAAEVRDEDTQVDRALWEEQEEESDSEQDLPLSDECDSEEYSTGDEAEDEDESSLATESDEAGDPDSEDTDQESNANTAGSIRRRRGSNYASERVGRLTRADNSSRLKGLTGSADLQRAARSPSRARILSSSLRDPTQELSPDREKQRRHGHVDHAHHRGGDKGQSQKDDTNTRRARNARAFSHYLGYPVDFLAEMLAPKRELCNGKFELVIDGLAFIGHPVLWKDAVEASQSRGRTGFGGEEPSDSAEGEGPEQPDAQHRMPDVEFFHLVFVIQPPDPSYASPTLDLTTWLGLWYDSIIFKMTAGLWAEQQRASFVSGQTGILQKLWGQVEGDLPATGLSFTTQLSRILMSSSLARSLRQAYRILASPPQDRTPYVTLNDSLDIHLQLPPLLIDPYRMVRSIQELGPSIDVDDADLFGDASTTAVGEPLDEWIRATGPPLLPWKTLLLLHDESEGEVKERRFRSVGGLVVEVEDADDESEQELDAALEGDAGVAEAGIELWTKKFTSLLKPTLQGIPTFTELASLLSWDLMADVYPMARHLVYYKQARVSDVPRIQNTYTVSPLFEVQQLARFTMSFALRFPEQPPLVRLLATLGSSLQPFLSHYSALQRPQVTPQEASGKAMLQSALRRQALEVLIWLLRNEIVIQQHLRFRLIATENVKKKAIALREAHKVARAEERRKRDEKREWMREMKALRQGADPLKRKGDMVPLAPQSAPATALLNRAQLPSLSAPRRNERADAGQVRLNRTTDSVATDAPTAGTSRGRQRSRSAEPRERRDSTDGAASAGEELPVGNLRLAGRSGSRNPAPLGRVSVSGALTPRSRSKAEASRKESPKINFERRRVSRSRSPSSAFPFAMTSTENGNAASAAVSTSGAATDATTSEATLSLSSGTDSEKRRHHRALSSSSAGGSSQHGGSGHGSSGLSQGAAGLSSTPRIQATQMLAAEQQKRRRDASLIRDSARGMTKVTAARPHDELTTARDATPAHEAATPAAAHLSASMTRRGRWRDADGHGSRPAAETSKRYSRSPSEARLRIRGFGDEDEKVWIDGKEVILESTSDNEADASGAVGQGPAAETSDASNTAAAGTTLAGDETVCAPATPESKASEHESDRPAEGEVSGIDIPDNAGVVATVDANAVAQTAPDGARISRPSSNADRDGHQVDASAGRAASQSSADDASSDEFELSSNSGSDSELDSDTDLLLFSDAGPSLIADPSRASGVENLWISAMVHEYTEKARSSLSSSRRGSSAVGAGPLAAAANATADKDATATDRDRDGDEAIRREEEEEAAEIVQAFFRLLPYLNGRHTIDEVLCREGMRRRQLRTLLSHFKDEIMTFVHP
ncbi:unnamed protein product [Parajaminaea phylloscopi]